MKTIIAILASSAAAGLLMGACQPKAEVSQTPQPKPRTIVTCDPELDDNNSMVRFILHSTDFDIEGLVETSSQFHWSGDGKGTKYFHPGREYDRPGFNHGPMESYRWEADSVNFINRILDAYQECYPNLKVHDPSYPDPSYLKSISVVGNIDFEGEMDHDTEGSNLIRDRILADKPGELFLQAWGGTSSIARALKSIEDTYKGTPAWDSLVNVINSRVVLCMSGEQDDTYKDYIHPHWPGIHRMNVMGGGLGLAYNSQRRLRNPEDSVYYSAKWMADNVTSKGPIGARVYVWGDGKHISRGFDAFDYFGIPDKTREELQEMGYFVWSALQPKGQFLAEGDDGCYTNMIGNGLRAWQDETWGGWGGRHREMPQAEGGDTMKELRRQMFQADTVFPDFLPEAQNAYAARLLWSVTQDYSAANHYPVLAGPLELSAKAGKTVRIKLDAKDPDGNALTVDWHVWAVGSYKGKASLTGVKADGKAVADPRAFTFDGGKLEASLTVPADAAPGQTIHVVARVTDNGKNPLTKYLRTVVTVK